MSIIQKLWPIAILLAVISIAGRAAAQTPNDGNWQFVESPYLIGASMDGTMAVRGHELDVNVSASDIFSNLQFGFMNYFEAKKGNWGFSNDIVYMALGTTTETPAANVDPTEFVISFFGIRRLNENVDLLFGARVNSIRGKIELKDFARTWEQDKTWIDPVVGIRLSGPMGNHWRVGMPASFGGFGLGSKISIDAFPNVQFRVSSKAYLGFGWRFIYINYEDQADSILPVRGNIAPDTGGFRYDVLTQGPVLGLVFRF